MVAGSEIADLTEDTTPDSTDNIYAQDAAGAVDKRVALSDLPISDATQAALDALEAGGISDGDKGDITVSSSGTVWTIDDGAVTAAKVAADVATQSELDAVAATIPTTEATQDLVGAMVSGGTETGISVTYDDTNARLDFVAEVTQAELDAMVSDTAYDGTSWNSVTTVAPSKNAVRDAIEALSLAGVSWPLDHTGATAATDAITLDVTGDTQLRFVVDHDGTMYKGTGSIAPLRFLKSDAGAGIGTGSGAPGSCHVGHLAGLVDTSEFATSFGNEALMSNTTGLYNTAVGARVLRDLIDGDYNAAVGMDSAQRITTGNRNVAMGVSAMSYVTTTSDNVAIGYQALQQSTGYNNVAIGASAIVGAGASYSNTAIGTAAMGSCTSGALNVAIGYTALTSCTTAGGTVAIGAGAMYSSNDGNYDTAIGWEAAYGMTSGQENVAIGRRALARPAGVQANATTTGSYNVAVGDETGQAGTTARSNMTLLGYRALGDAAGAVAVGSTAQALHSGGIALGDTSVTTAVNQLRLGGRHIEIVEMTAPGAGATNSARLYAVDNGGKTQLCVVFATGAVQVLATEP